DAGTGNAPELTVHPDPTIPSLVLLTPNARGALEDMRDIGFTGYLVKPVRQASLITRLILCRGDAPVEASLKSARAIPAAALAPDLPPLVNPREPGVRDIANPIPASVTENRPAAMPPRISEHSSQWSMDPVLPKGIPTSQDARFSKGALADAPGLHILLAEDNPINMMLIRELLRRRGHKVTEVTTGTDAVKAMADSAFDLLLTDIHMPGMDGIEATRAIRAGEARSGRARTPIVALTADALEAGKRQCKEAGMDGFLTKPVDPSELEEMFLMLFPSEDGSHIVAA
ncbi:MAG TPA: response regulator, partial [Rhizomicrobium sp.]|nr:response regulator [Rhizomicrobium sp.]